MDDSSQGDICRVCRSEGTPEKPLFHPCICTGSIKFIHQECLVQWLKYSEKEYCELCNYRFSFIPIYSPDMPKRLPIRDIIHGLIGSLATALNFWFHYTLVAIAWLGVVPLTAYRIYKCLFSGSPSALFTLPIDLLSTENLFSDGFYGCCVVTCALCTFIALVWLREQIMRGGGPEWLDPNANGGQVNGGNIGNEVPVEAQGNVDDVNNVNDPIEHAFDGENENAPLLPQQRAHNDQDEAQAVVQNVLGLVEDAPEVQVNNEANNAPVQNGGVQPVAPPPPPAVVPAVVAQDEGDWIPGEWDRAGEELTWERILGLDGSLVFLEHVFWVVSLNTLLIIIFAFCPYYIGQFILEVLDLTSLASASQFEGLVTTLSGYCVISICLVILHAFASLLHFRKTERFLGICYVIVKVSLLILCELGVFPLVCGWWLDICSLPMMGATIQEREASFKSAPGTSMFIHWAVGIMYVFYFASIMLLLREVMRPGVLWFLQNLNDPDFNPIQEMIHLPIGGHLRRFIVSLIIFGTTVLLMIWFPVNIIQKIMPGFLPYNVSMSSTNDSPVGELSVEFLLLQLILPALLDHGHLRQWLKVLVRSWCIVASYILDIRSYLLGDVPLPEDETLLANDEQVVQPSNEASNQPYIRPKWFALRLFTLVALAGLSLFLGGLLMLTLPVIIGRKLIGLWMGDARIHELNTAACGLYAGLLSLRIIMLVASWLPRGWGAILRKLKEGLLICTKTIFAGVILLGVIPLLIGILFDVVIIVPMRVPTNQTPIFYLWQDWAFGVLHAKVICGLAMMGEWRLKQVLEEIYQAGIVNINLKTIMTKLAIPVIISLGLGLSVPYLLVWSLSFCGVTSEVQMLVLRRIYPSLLFATLIIYLVTWQVNKFCRLYEHIKNDKYLVGKRLVNYDPKKREVTPVEAKSTGPAGDEAAM